MNPYGSDKNKNAAGVPGARQETTWQMPGRITRKKARERRFDEKYGKFRKPVKIVSVILVFALLYIFVCFTQFSPIRTLRTAYIETAMSTMSHQWLAEWFFPRSVVDEVVNNINAAEQAQIGLFSRWINRQDLNAQHNEVSSEDVFYMFFRELDRDSFDAYLEKHPETLKDGWKGIYINEAGINDKGTEIRTRNGDQVLAIDAKNKILLIRVEGTGYQGVLAIAKDSSRLSCCTSKYIGSAGQKLDAYAEANNGVLLMNGSGFIDEDGRGSGGQFAGLAVSHGKVYGSSFGYGKRIELHEDNLMYITDATTAPSPGTTDAVEFSPALIIDGEVLVNEFSAYSSINPRACIGQNVYGEVMMLVIEGRLVGRSIGCGVAECAKIAQRYNCYQMLNLDGGTSASLWYDGEYVIKCSNTNIKCRDLPNAWVYERIG